MSIARRSCVLALLVLVGCTGGDDGDATTTTTTVRVTTTERPDEPAPDRTVAYVQALADPTVDAASLATGDAAHYLEHRRTTAAVLGVQLVAFPGSTDHRICTANDCATLSDVVTDPATGRVQTFSVDDVPLAGRITGSGLVADDDGIVAQVRTAYVTNAGQLVVTAESSNTTDTDVELFGFAAVLRPADGTSGLEASGSFGDATVATGAGGVLVLVFDTDQLGGRIGLTGIRRDGLDVSLALDVPAAPNVGPDSTVSRDSGE